MRKTVLTVAAATAIFAGCADAFAPMPLAVPRARATSAVSLRMSEDASDILARMEAMMRGEAPPAAAPVAAAPPPAAAPAYAPPAAAAPAYAPPAAYAPAPAAAPPAAAPPAAAPPAAAPPAAQPATKTFSWDPPDVTAGKINAVLNSPGILNHPERGQKEVSFAVICRRSPSFATHARGSGGISRQQRVRMRLRS